MFDQTGQEHRHLQNRNHVFSTFLFKLSFRALKLNPSSKNEDKSPQKGCHFPRSFFWCSKFKPFFFGGKKTNKNTQKVSTRRNALPEGFRPRCLDHFALLLSGRQQHLRCRSASGARTGFGRRELEALRGPRLGLQVGMEPGCSLQLPGVPPLPEHGKTQLTQQPISTNGNLLMQHFECL